MNDLTPLAKDSKIDHFEQRRNGREKLEMEAKVMMLRCCMVDENGNKLPKAEALLDFQFIMDSLELQRAAAMIDGFYRKKNKFGKRSGFRLAMEALLNQEVIAHREIEPGNPTTTI